MSNKELNVSIVKFGFLFLLVIVSSGFLYEFDEFKKIVDFVSNFIPAVDRFGFATSFPEKTRSAWAVSWVFSPLMLFFYYKLTNNGSSGDAIFNRNVLSIFIFIFIASLLISYFGMFDKFGSDSGVSRINSVFGSSVFFMYLFTFFIWVSMFFSFFYIVGYFKKNN